MHRAVPDGRSPYKDEIESAGTKIKTASEASQARRGDVAGVGFDRGFPPPPSDGGRLRALAAWASSGATRLCASSRSISAS